MNISMLSFGVALMFMMIIGSATYSGGAFAASQCKPVLEGPLAQGTIRKRVKKRAKRQWGRKAKSQYGSNFSKWSIAQNRRFQCGWSNETNTFITGNKCRAIANPCPEIGVIIIE